MDALNISFEAICIPKNAQNIAVNGLKFPPAEEIIAMEMYLGN